MNNPEIPGYLYSAHLWVIKYIPLTEMASLDNIDGVNLPITIWKTAINC